MAPNLEKVDHVDGNILHIEDVALRRMSVTQPHFAELTHEARDATRSERDMTFLQALKLYPKAIAWSVVLSTAIIMEAYDIQLISTFYAFPKFREKYGVRGSDGTYEVPASWQSGLSNGALVGEIIGLFINGYISERYGYRKSMLMSLVAMTIFIFIPFFAQNVQTLLVGEVFQGLPWGVFQTLTTAYASEVCPVALRAYLTAYVNLCWVIGQLIGIGVLTGLLKRKDEWAYRIPFAIQWIWPIPLLVGVYFASESPWWLVRQGRTSEARAVMLRLTNKSNNHFNADETVAMMVHTNELEKEISSGTSFLDCFKGVDLRRTEISAMVYAIQILCGSAFMGYSTYFYEQAGVSTTDSFKLSLGQYAIAFVGVLLAWVAMGYLGRRTLYLVGLLVLNFLLLIIGFVALAPESVLGAKWAIVSMLLLYTFFYDVTIGPVCYSLVSEISSVRLRSKTIALARIFYNIVGCVNNIITPRMLNPTAWNWGPKAAFFWVGVCFLCLIWTYFRLPEPKGRSYGELDVLFERKVSARRFKSTVVDPFTGDTLVPVDSVDSTEKVTVEIIQKERGRF